MYTRQTQLQLQQIQLQIQTIKITLHTVNKMQIQLTATNIKGHTRHNEYNANTITATINTTTFI
jgi:hypothetical protein